MPVNVSNLLCSDGAIARRLSGYESRPQQSEMAAAVERTLHSRGRLMVEAGTGIGKSFAYLIPAIKRIVDNDERVIIATNTISLQEQLIEKDIPLLNAVVPDEFSSVLVKGRGNYVSLRRLKRASEKQDRLFSDDNARHTLHRIEDWAHSTQDGSLSTLPQLSRPEVWDSARSDSGNCMGKKCPTYKKCFYQSARRRMENGDLLICNHALFFADLALRNHGVGFLPPYDHVILDEAHNVENVAADHFGLRLTEGGVSHLLRLLYQPRNQRGFLTTLNLKDNTTKPIDETIEHVLKCYDRSGEFFDSLYRRQENYATTSGRVREPAIVKNTLTTPMKELSDRLKFLRQRARSEQDQFELHSYAQRAGEISRETAILLDQEIKDCAYWLEQSNRMNSRIGRPRITFACAPIEVGPILREQFFEQEWSTVLCSATLATGPDDFSHMTGRLGCDDGDTLQLGSPFDYKTQVRLIVERSMPPPNSPKFVESIEPRVLHHIRETDGGAFVLFTSFAMLNKLANSLKPTLVEEGYSVHVHGKDGPRSVLLRRFGESDRSVLFGTASFWQGVDVRGQTLRNVLITRLPFDVPDRPIVQARHEKIIDRGGNPFMEDQIPNAVIRFKQGFGRLIRSTTDTGRVVVLDPRVVKKAYGKKFLEALPSDIRTEQIET